MEHEKMETLEPFLAKVQKGMQQERVREVLQFVLESYPELTPKIAWNQPMFTDHETFIIAFSVSKKHMAIAPEEAAIIHFSKEISQSGYENTKGIIRIPWEKEFDFVLLKKIIEYNIIDKKDCTSFWRK